MADLTPPPVAVVYAHHYDGDMGQYDSREVGLNIDGVVVWLGGDGYGRDHDAYAKAERDAKAIAEVVSMVRRAQGVFGG